MVEIPGGGGGGASRTVYEVDDTIETMPTNSWSPDRTHRASVSEFGGMVTVTLKDGGFVEEGDYRYTCESAGGCRIDDRVVTSGTVVETLISETQAPDLVVESSSVSSSDVEPGASFTLSATVRNAGDGDAAATTLRYYRSSDESVSTADTEVGTEAIGALAASATADGSITVEAPRAAGAYHYGACVDSVPGESNSGNNCSNALQVSVAEGGATEGEDFDLDRANGAGAGIAYANGRFYVLDTSRDKVYAYRTNGERDAASDFDLDADNRLPERIVHGGGRYYVVDTLDDKVYAYTTDGRRDPGADFDLAADNRYPAGLAFANGRIHVVDHLDDKVYVYGADGQRVATADFDLVRDNRSPEGLAHHEGRFYVADQSDDKVFAYDSNGQRDAAAEFDLDGDNDWPSGMVAYDGRFYVLDDRDDRVYVYNPDGPDLAVESPSVSNETPDLGAAFTFSGHGGQPGQVPVGRDDAALLPLRQRHDLGNRHRIGLQGGGRDRRRRHGVVLHRADGAVAFRRSLLRGMHRPGHRRVRRRQQLLERRVRVGSRAGSCRHLARGGRPDAGHGQFLHVDRHGAEPRRSDHNGHHNTLLPFDQFDDLRKR